MFDLSKGEAELSKVSNILQSHNSLNAQEDAMLLPSGNTTITESANSIFSVIAQKRDIYIFGGAICDLKKNGDQFSLTQVSPEAFRSRIECYGKKVMSYVAYKDDFLLKAKPCSMDSARALMASQSADELLPHVRAIVSCPVLTRDLEVLSAGYHQENEILVTHGRKPVDVSTNEAVKGLKGLLADNEFITPSDAARALSMMILPMLKMSGFILEPCPMDTAEANESQSGKTYRQKVIAAIYNSSPLVVTQKNGGVGSVDESISSALATGRPFVLLDNFRGNFDSPMLEAIITTPDCVSIRIPRLAEQVIDATAVSFQLSSNGVNTTTDMANRSCIIRIRKQSGKQWKSWPEGDLLSHVKANQHYYLGCVIAIVKEWVTSGMLRTSTTEHDMREWAQSMDWIVQRIFKTVPLLEGHQNIQQSVSSPQLTWLREVCLYAERYEKLNVDLLSHNIAEICEFSDIEYPNKRKYQNSEAAYKYIGTIMCKMFSKQGVVIIDNYKVTKTEREIFNEKIRRHKLSKIYKIEILSTKTQVFS